jgi:hypothetical protein
MAPVFSEAPAPSACPLREIPGWCSWRVIGTASDWVGLERCKPYSEQELQAQTQCLSEYACRRADDPEACSAVAVAQAEEAVAAFRRQNPDDDCAYLASQDWPTVSGILGPEAVCKLRRGDWNTYLLLGGVALVGGLLLLGRR